MASRHYYWQQQLAPYQRERYPISLASLTFFIQIPARVA